MPVQILVHPSTFLLRQSVLLRPARFHTTAALKSKLQNHYEALGLTSHASTGVIKKQFYLLSKKHHPDHNPEDPHASDRFVKISEAYTILGNPEKRDRYDRDFQRSQGLPSTYTTRGSHSSASTPYGSRPASGLSRRRSQFKGPPPSFYRSDKWGAQGRRRQSQADASWTATTGDPRAGCFGAGQGQPGFSNDVPHFDHEGHYRTQEQQEQRRRRRVEGESLAYTKDGSVFLNFILVGSVVTFALFVPSLFKYSSNSQKQARES